MCLIGFALDAHPRYRLILAGNRDEAYARPTLAAGWWDEGADVYGGRDASAGGGWLAINRDGRLAAVTNYRQPVPDSALDPFGLPRPSRGALVRGFVETGPLPREANPSLETGDAHFIDGIARQAMCYAGFNLLLIRFDGPTDTGEPSATRAQWISNRSPDALAVDLETASLPRPAYSFTNQSIAPGVHGLSNALLDTDWPKLRKLKQAIASTLTNNDAASIRAMLFAALADQSVAQDAELPDTGIGLERERLLAPAFIQSAVYGTRASTVILVGIDGSVEFRERSFSADGSYSQRDAQFALTR